VRRLKRPLFLRLGTRYSSAMSASAPSKDAAVTTRDFLAWKAEGRKIVVVTAYDALFGRLVDEAGVDCALVGDSVNQVVCGEPSTLSATLDQMIYHARAVRRGVKRALVVVDLPFLSYQVSREDALRSAGRVMKETGAQAVKLEGGAPMADVVRALVEVGIPVMGHIGLTPQSVHALGGYRVQGRDEAAARRLESDAAALEEAGAFAIVLELVPAALAGGITAARTVPTIGIGAGVGCDGQVLVLHDLLGLNDGFAPRFLKRYAALAGEVRDAVGRFGAEVRRGAYPDPDHSF
jgi:3-methyl-2-oxobutanoate hydroxymethyltransferase